MHRFHAEYCKLISSLDQLNVCRQERSLPALLQTIKALWHCEALSDDALLGYIYQLNRNPITTSSVVLAGVWLPYRYRPVQQCVNWLLPVDHAVEPFQDEYISRCRCELLNQVIQPCTSLEVVQQQSEKLSSIDPTGFIYHLSRCGSTLVSGCLSELASTCVFSESPLLTELLLDNHLSRGNRQTFLRMFIALQASVFPGRHQVIIKWNAWDIFMWDIINAAYPQVPVIFLVRDPVEILASHKQCAGRHMSGDVNLFNEAFMPALAGSSELLLDFQIRVMQHLLLAMESRMVDDQINVVDYCQLNNVKIQSIANVFHLLVTQDDNDNIARRMQKNAKILTQDFVEDSAHKQNMLTVGEQEKIHQWLFSSYKKLYFSSKIQKGLVYEQ